MHGGMVLESWIYVFSKFTPEALLLEAFLISILLTLYSTFWLLKKRRIGFSDTAIPAGLVKTYLNALINDAESLRSQLFGLLKNSGLDPNSPAFDREFSAALSSGSLALGNLNPNGAALLGTGAADPLISHKLNELEQKMREQALAMERLILDKSRVETELSAVRVTGDAGGAASGSEIAKLHKRIKELEDRLAEYAVIEDELAQLKRLQQENAQLKAALGGAPAPVIEPMKVEEPPPPETLEPLPVVETPAPPADLLDSSGAKTDADLVAEFEKMLRA